MSTIRTGVAGVGHLGYHHARLYNKLENSELVGVHDIDRARGEEVAKEFHTKYCATLEELVEAGAEAVSVAVPTIGHHDVGKFFLENGCHVLVEKPIAKTLEEAQDLVDIAKSNDRLLQVGHVERFNGAVIAVRDRFKDPGFIECHRMSPYPNRGDDVSVILDLMIHDIDVILSLVNSEVKSIDAVGVPIFSEQEDIANVRIRFENNCVANLTASRISLERMRKIRIFQSEAYVSTDYSQQEVMVYRRKPDPAHEIESPMELIKIESLEVQRDEPLLVELRSFLDSVRDGTTPVVSGEDGLKALKLAYEIMDFIREHS